MARKAKQPQSKRWSEAPWAAVLVVATLIAYAPAMNAGFIWDDPDYVINNANLRSIDGLWHTWSKPRSLPQYYPLVHTTFWIEFQLWGLRASGYHVVNILLHAASAVLLWRVLRKLEVPGAWLAAAIFALHPVQVESVAWITERKNVLSGVFYFAAMLAYLRAYSGKNVTLSATKSLGTATASGDPEILRCAQDDSRSHTERYFYVLSLALFLCALLSKTVTCSLPAAILLILYWKNGRITWAEFRPLVPFFVLGLIAAGVTPYFEKKHVGAEGPEWDLSFIERCLIAGRALWFYASKLVWPVDLAFIYPKWDVDPKQWWQWVFPLGFVATVLALWLSPGRPGLGRGAVVAVLLFAGTLLPALGFFNIYPMRYSFVADHFQYLASAGLIALIVASAKQLAERFGQRKIANAAAAIVLLTLGILTCRQSRIYHDALTLWSDTAQKNPESWMVHTNLGQALVASERHKEAFEQFQLALNLAAELPETHWNVAVGLAKRGELDEALKEVERAIRLDSKFAQAYFTRGTIYRRQGRVDEAVEQFIITIELQPAFSAAHYELGRIFNERGQLDLAEKHYFNAVASRLDDADAHYDLANVLVKRRQFEQAAVHYSQAIRILPDWAEAHANLGAALAQLGRREEAIQAFRRALQLNPNLVPAQVGLVKAQG